MKRDIFKEIMGGIAELSQKDVALITANFGGTVPVNSLFCTQLGPPPVDTYYYCDDLAESKRDLAFWPKVIVPDFPAQALTSRLKSNWFSCQFHRIEGMEKYRWLMWADASILHRNLQYPVRWAAFLQALPTNCHWISPASRPLGVNTVIELYEMLVYEMEKGNEYLRSRYSDTNMKGALDYLERKGYSLDAPVRANTLFMFENTPVYRAIMDEWWDVTIRYCSMGELTLPPILKAHGVEPQDCGQLVTPAFWLLNPDFTWMKG